MGLVFKPENQVSWMQSHAQVPTVHVINDRFRVFFSSRNADGKSLTACIDLDIDNPAKILKLYEHAVLGFGNPGTFDDDGVMPGYTIKQNNQLWMYYSGWNQRVNVPYHNAMGLAVSNDDGLTFQRMYEGPILDRIPTEPYIAVTPSILQQGDQWQMWYVSGINWALIGEKYEPVYVIKYAHSKDGIHWQRPNINCIPQKHALEAFSHPNVIFENGQYHMWYSFRDSTDFRDGAGSYRMGYSTSSDGIQWIRQDEKAGITVSEEGWDSKMICYPYVVTARNKRFMFYNGNSFGKSGFGYAIWEGIDHEK